VKASDETRHIAYELHSSVLDDLGLAASLRSLCEEFSHRAANVKLKFTHGDSPSSVPRAVVSCLYRFAQESLNNIEKHAQAQHVMVALSFKEATLVLAIADDGVGFDREAIKGRGGLGLIGMGERVGLVNGKLSIETRPGHGTQIAMELRLLGSNV
jgi:two-component system NarL family sensor kinase